MNAPPAACTSFAVFGFVLGTMMIPSAVTMIPSFLVMTRLHMINTYWAMILPGAAGAFGAEPVAGHATSWSL